MTPEQAMAFSQGEFRGEVLTKLDTITKNQDELKKDVQDYKAEHKKDHHDCGIKSKPVTGLDRAKGAAMPVTGGAGLLTLAVVAILERL